MLVGGSVAGWSDYRLRGDRLSVLHTEIAPEHEGGGLGSVLVRGLVDDARARGLGVLPFCPFTRSWLARHPEHLDVVPVTERARFDLPT